LFLKVKNNYIVCVLYHSNENSKQLISPVTVKMMSPQTDCYFPLHITVWEASKS